MLLTGAEYRRGIVKWAATNEATASVRTVIGGHEIESARMSDSLGSVPNIEASNLGSMTLRVVVPGLPLGQCHVVWDRCYEDRILAVANIYGVADIMLSDLPWLGQYSRLILSTPYLDFGDGWVIRAGDVVARFTNVVRFEGFERELEEHHGNRSTFIETFSEKRLEGSFIDIVAPDAGGASDTAFAIVALVSLVLGDAAIGDLVHRGELDGTHAGTQNKTINPNYVIPSAPNQTMRMPMTPPQEWFEELDRLLVRFTLDTEVQTNVVLPLRWYERAVRTGNDVDKFLAAFVALESLVGTLGKRLATESPIAELLSDDRVPQLLAPLRKFYEDDKVDRLIAKLQDRNQSLLDRFGVVATSLGLTDEQRETFYRANKARNPLVHGRAGTIETALASHSLDLLGVMLKATLTDSALT